jgi:hypothetical protein
MAFGLYHAAQASTCRRIRPKNARCRESGAWRLESLLSQESLGEGDQHGGVNHNATGATRIVVMVSPPNATSNVAIWSGRPDRRLPLRLCRQHNRRRLCPPPSHRSKASRNCLLSLARPRPEQRRVRLKLHATQPHVENALPQKRGAKRFRRQLCSCRHSDGAPLSSNRYLWGGGLLVCADIESAGRGARVPVEVEHDPLAGEVDAGTDERRTGAEVEVAC